MLDLTTLEQERSRWIRLKGALDGFEVLIKHRSLRERERFENRMIREGIMKKDGTGVNPGRLLSLIEAWTEEVIIGWKVPERFRGPDTKEKNPPYQPSEMAKILNAAPSSLDHIFEEVKEEADFFSGNGSASTG